MQAQPGFWFVFVHQFYLNLSVIFFSSSFYKKVYFVVVTFYFYFYFFISFWTSLLLSLIFYKKKDVFLTSFYPSVHTERVMRQLNVNETNCNTTLPAFFWSLSEQQMLIFLTHRKPIHAFSVDHLDHTKLSCNLFSITFKLITFDFYLFIIPSSASANPKVFKRKIYKKAIFSSIFWTIRRDM